MSEMSLITPEMLEDHKKLKKELDESEIGFWDYLMYRGNFELAIAFSKLFWPEFVVVDDFILLKEKYEPEHFSMWRQQLNDDKTRVEALINHVHMYDLFLDTENDANRLPPKALTQLGETLVHLWRLALKEQFPKRIFEVTLSDSLEDYGPTITFYQARPTTSP